MNSKVPDRLTSTFEEEELKGFSRSMAELQWLLIILSILYFFIPTRPITDTNAMIITLVSYSGLVMLFRYLNFHARETRWKLAIETWAMIAFITTILWHTGMVESPLLNLYLLVIIACAITLGKVMTLLEVALIACCYLYMGYQVYSVEVVAPETFTMLMAKFSPFLLVAYVTSMLASDIKSAKSRITVMSQTDELTGLLNMRAFNTILEKEIAAASRYSTPYTVLMIDIDSLKQINDHVGHSAGSRLIKSVASSLKNCVRNSDVLARYGGDEFVVLMPQTSTEHAQIAAERIRAAIDNTSFDMNGNRVTSTVSIGIASYPDCVSEAEAVLDKADVALYKSKHSGRNQVTYYDKTLEVLAAIA
ncbi:MAG: GGDEF domain-containing protein [Thiohalobacterales bacterium]